ncbi:hypothetical protein MY4038_009656 [Beauveria bassiana]
MSSDETVFKGSPSGDITECRRRRRPLSDGEVRVEITHSGVCGTDEHYRLKDMVLGHEGVGVVVEIGRFVEEMKPGDRVGWGYCHGSCGSCRACRRGQNLYCDERELYGFTNLDQGSFATHATFRSKALVPIPAAIESRHAAPLMCAGAAVYSAIRRAELKAGDRVGVLGVGGLGHLAIQFAAKMGCNVVAFSSSPEKRSEALLHGAHEFRDINDAVAVSSADQVICLLLTAAKQPDWHKVLPWVERGGTISAMTVDTDNMVIPYMTLVMNAIQIQGSLPAPSHMHREMLDLAALHSIRPQTELFALDGKGIKMAMDRLRSGRVRYRAVLEHSC